MVHLSYGMKEPASPHLRSECAIIAGMAQATLPEHADAVGGLRRRLRPHPRHDGAGARRLRGLQPPGAPAARLPDPAAGARAGLPHAVGPRRVLRRRRCPTSSRPAGTADARRRCARTTSGTPRSTPNDDRYRGRQEPAHARLHERATTCASAGSSEFDLVDITSIAPRRQHARRSTATAPSPTTSRAAAPPATCRS